jgi:hypothetical protein
MSIKLIYGTVLYDLAVKTSIMEKETKETHIVERSVEGEDYQESTERTVETHKTSTKEEIPETKRTQVIEETTTETYSEE